MYNDIKKLSPEAFRKLCDYLGANCNYKDVDCVIDAINEKKRKEIDEEIKRRNILLEIDKKNMIENLDLMIAGSNLTDVVKALSNVKFDGIDECKKHLYTNYDDDLKALTTSIMSENKDFDNNKIYKEIIIPFMEYNDEYTKQNSRRNKPK